MRRCVQRASAPVLATVSSPILALVVALILALAAVFHASPSAAQEEGSAARPGDARPEGPVGPVTKLPLPRYVTLKGSEGNARRGPGLTHRIDWVFRRAGMPLRVTAEYENWRRVEDQDGLGGWVHYSLLSGSRSALVTAPMLDLRAAPDPGAQVLVQAEAGVVGRILACAHDWCRIEVGQVRAWAPATALWGVDPGETLD